VTARLAREQVSARFVAVAVPVPRLDRLTYRVPEPLAPPVPGARVLVPLGSRQLTGCVVERLDLRPALPEEAIRDLVDVLDEEPFVPPEILTLVAWVADYYLCGWGEALDAAVPPGAWVATERLVTLTPAGWAALGEASGREGEVLRILAAAHGTLSLGALARRLLRVGPPGAKPSRVGGLVARLVARGFVALERRRRGRVAAFRTVAVARLTAAGRADSLPPLRGRRQREALERLREAPAGMAVSALAAAGIRPATLRALAARGLVEIERQRLERRPRELDWPPVGPAAMGEAPGDAAVRLTGEQQRALGRLRELATAGGFRVALLHGVTGSGKTEVYVRLARAVREQGRSVLMLVPEIALTPAAVAAFRRAFGERVAIQHSGLAAGERYDQWHLIRDGRVDIVVGTRSAVFAPLARLGLVIVDEEHDPSYKQQEAPRYHGRDVAVMRGRQAGALVVLGSATPSIESYHNALVGRYERIVLSRRVFDRPLADVQIVDMRAEYAARGPEVVLSGPLRTALASCLRRRDQALVLLNRRGFAVAVFCRQCGSTLECPNCSVSLTVHRARGRAQCHYCNYARAVPRRCAACGGSYLEQIGFGTERVELEIRKAFPTARVERLDRETAARRGAPAAILGRFARGEIDVLVGTQMIAKGHDFPGVTLVGVVSADVGLGLADFRAAERTFQLLTQVAGRAGRGAKPGVAIVQTLYPDHYSIRHACGQDYEAFFRDEMAFRRALRYPPAVALVNVIVRGRSFEAALRTAATLASELRALGSGFRVLGPAPAPLGRLRGQFRAQFFLKGTDRRAMRQALRAVLARRPDLGRDILVDVDPVSVL
jgi:primosomal protein N' (replication factor Y)